MKLILIATAMIMSLGLRAEVELYCFDRFNNDIPYNFFDQEFRGSCYGDLIWGKDNICFTGNAGTLVQLMNQKYFNRTSRGYLIYEAKQVDQNTISYIGVDQQVFWSTEATLKRCP